MYNSIRDQFPSGSTSEETWYSIKAGIDCPDIGLRIVTLALFPGKLQANNPIATSTKPAIRIIIVRFFIKTFHSVITPALKTKHAP